MLMNRHYINDVGYVHECFVTLLEWCHIQIHLFGIMHYLCGWMVHKAVINNIFGCPAMK